MTVEEFEAIRGATAWNGPEHSLLTRLRAEFPDVAFSKCDAADLDDAPQFSRHAFDVHLLDAQSHCVAVTRDIARASGVLLAKRRDGP